MKDKLNAIFDEHEEVIDTTLNTVNIGGGLDTKHAPVSIALKQGVFSVIHGQHSIVNKAFLHMFFRRLALTEHLTTLKQIYFGG